MAWATGCTGGLGRILRLGEVGGLRLHHSDRPADPILLDNLLEEANRSSVLGHRFRLTRSLVPIRRGTDVGAPGRLVFVDDKVGELPEGGRLGSFDHGLGLAFARRSLPLAASFGGLFVMFGCRPVFGVEGRSLAAFVFGSKLRRIERHISLIIQLAQQAKDEGASKRTKSAVTAI